VGQFLLIGGRKGSRVLYLKRTTAIVSGMTKKRILTCRMLRERKKGDEGYGVAERKKAGGGSSNYMNGNKDKEGLTSS